VLATELELAEVQNVLWGNGRHSTPRPSSPAISRSSPQREPGNIVFHNPMYAAEEF
jgi:hypothetical protein